MRKSVSVRSNWFWVVAAAAWCFFSSSYAGQPLWTFKPDLNNPPAISITPLGEAVIQYTITNQSRKAHTLVMKPITGLTQITSGGNCPSPFTLGYQQSCTLKLLVQGGLLTGSINGGPVVCQTGSTLQCYQPSAANALNITLIPLAKYLITPTAAANGAISPGTPQTVYAGTSKTFTAIPGADYQVDQWLLDGGIAQKGGKTFTLSRIDANHTLEVTFTRRGIVYAGTAGGSIYFSIDNGLTWTATTIPSSGHEINSIFATPDTLYAGSSDGTVYYSTNNGAAWNATSAVPGGVAVNSIFVSSLNNVLTLYSGTADGKVYYSTDGTTWNATTTDPGTGAVNGLFITSEQLIYAGSDDGNIYYSLNNGSTWNLMAGPEASTPVPIHNIFATSTQLYVTTRHISSNSTLPPGTVDFEYAYFTNNLTNANPQWNLLSQITYTLFVNADASVIYAGTQGGYVFSLTTGDELGFITYSPITSLFFLG